MPCLTCYVACQHPMIQGELGSPGLEAFLQQHRSLLSADLVLAATGAPMQGEQGSVEALPNTPGNRLALEVWSQVLGKAREYNRCVHVDRSSEVNRHRVHTSQGFYRSYLRCGISLKTNSFPYSQAWAVCNSPSHDPQAICTDTSHNCTG